jgi:hypothetical protein
METSDIVLRIENRLRTLGFSDPLWIADTIRIIVSRSENERLSSVMSQFDLFLEEYWSNKLLLDLKKFPELKYEGKFLENLKDQPDFLLVAHTLKEQFSSRGKGFGKMVPRPIDFGGFARLSEEKIERKTLVLTSIFWILVYSLIVYFFLI